MKTQKTIAYAIAAFFLCNHGANAASTDNATSDNRALIKENPSNETPAVNDPKATGSNIMTIPENTPLDFHTLDKNQDGVLSKKEFNAGHRLDTDIFENVDTNSDTSISSSEFDTWIQKQSKNPDDLKDGLQDNCDETTSGSNCIYPIEKTQD